MPSRNHAAVAALAAFTLIACSASPVPAPPTGVTVRVPSSRPDQVTGGDARIAITAAPGLQDRLGIWLNGRQITPVLARDGEHMEGVITGLSDGHNELEVRYRDANGNGVSDKVALTNYPISGPIFTGPQQQPFICRSQESGLGQPLVDNHDGIGHPVFDATGALAGYSKTCAIPTRVSYFYFTGSAFKPFDPATGFSTPPPDLKTTPLHGAAVPFVVRVEAGSINRFLYTMAMLAPFPEPAGQPDTSAWNRKLVYWLRGGIGIGHQQGLAMWLNDNLSGSERQLMPAVLGQGFAVVSSSGNEAGVHYNMRLAEETALMTKERFIEAYGAPLFTIGMGGSGGAVQQYLFAQNNPRLLDGGVPIQSFPDMVTQTIPISDCPLLGQYFRDEVTRDPSSQWASWRRQALIEGMNASDSALNPLTGVPGSTECINGWRTAMPTVLNPVFKDPRFDSVAKAYGYPPSVFDQVKWTHWNDLANIYGTDSAGFAPIPIDNVGVQYGLRAFALGDIDADEFLRINACVGSWKEQPDFVNWNAALDAFDARNMQRSADCREPGGTPAARRAGDLSAMRAAYTSGHVFTGARLAIPVIDLRPYLEPELNMHNARQSFSVRARLLAANPRAAKRQVIWFTGSDTTLLQPVVDALGVMDNYLSGGEAPAAFVDTCFDSAGARIASGPAVWDGVLDGRAPGACTSVYPIHASPRMVAGEGIEGERFKCTLKPLATALADGTYAPAAPFTPAQRQWLERIFPDGVCDYSRPDQGRPDGDR